MAEQVFGLSQALDSKWVESDCRAIREILQIVSSDFSLSGLTLGYTINKPLDVLAQNGDWDESGVFHKICR
ncbi:MAG: hypothetical protein AAGL66_03700 [Pseudomonadota bacterium]